MIKSNPEKLLKKHAELIHTDMLKVVSHVEREKDDWIIHTLMIEGVSAPFRFRRKQRYKNLKGQRVNLTYYRDVEIVAGFELEVMNVVRIKVS
jgi:hypothetical protein